MAQYLPKSQELIGKLCVLRSTCTNDYNGLKALLNDNDTMEALKPYFKIDIWTDEAVKRRYEWFKNQHEAGTVITYTVRDLKTNEIIGDTGFKNIDLKNGTGEFGIILHKSTWGTGISKECHNLCLSNAFEVLGLKSVHFITDENNVRMQGFFKKTGISFKKKTAENYFNYEVNSKEWPRVKNKLAN